MFENKIHFNNIVLSESVCRLGAIKNARIEGAQKQAPGTKAWKTQAGGKGVQHALRKAAHNVSRSKCGTTKTHSASPRSKEGRGRREPSLKIYVQWRSQAVVQLRNNEQTN